MGLFAELNRRNVFRVAAAYAVLAWLVIQVTDVAVPALRLPDWVPSLVFFFCLLGFPFALLLAWAFELTPDGIKPEKQVDRSQSISGRTGRKIEFIIIALLAIAVVFLAIDRYVLDSGSAPSPAPDDAYDSIAVLPFVNLSDDDNQEYFSDGLTEQLLNALAAIRTLKVAARTSTFAFKGDESDIRVVGEALGVETVLEGSVRKAGSRLRINVQLIDAGSGFNLWSEQYDREMTDIFAVQDDITRNIVTALQPHIGGADARPEPSTSDSEAYDRYLQGMQGLHELRPQAIEQSRRHFSVATAIDPDYALAWTRQAYAVFLLSDDNAGDIPRDEAVALARSLNDQALALQPDLAEAHVMAARLYVDDYRYEDALQSIERALAAKPGDAEAQNQMAYILYDMGRISDADAALERAAELDPLHPTIAFSRQSQKCATYREPLSDAELARLYSDSNTPGQVLGLCEANAGNYAKFLENIEAAANEYNSLNLPLMWIRAELKDCTTPLKGPNREARRIMRLVACHKDRDALVAYGLLAPEQQAHGVTLEWISIAQLREGLPERALVSLDWAHDGRVPIAGQTGVGDISSNASLALDRVLARRQLNRSNEQDHSILSRTRAMIDNYKSAGMTRGYLLLEAKLLLLEGREDEAASLITRAADNLEMSWYDRYDPVLLAFFDQQELLELTSSVDQHVDAERAKLGLQPAEIY
jgi:TolB-like protein